MPERIPVHVNSCQFEPVRIYPPQLSRPFCMSTIQIHHDSADNCFVLNAAVLLPQPREIVFAFFSDAFQLERITPEWLHFQILTPPPISMGKGCLIDYRIRLRGIPIRWKTEITHWEPPFSFVDQQLKGPYRLWEHLHSFEETSEGTRMTDRVRYRVPGGRLVNWLLVQKDIERIFRFREEQMLMLFGGSR